MNRYHILDTSAVIELDTLMSDLNIVSDWFTDYHEFIILLPSFREMDGLKKSNDNEKRIAVKDAMEYIEYCIHHGKHIGENTYELNPKLSLRIDKGTVPEKTGPKVMTTDEYIIGCAKTLFNSKKPTEIVDFISNDQIQRTLAIVANIPTLSPIEGFFIDSNTYYLPKVPIDFHKGLPASFQAQKIWNPIIFPSHPKNKISIFVDRSSVHAYSFEVESEDEEIRTTTIQTSYRTPAIELIDIRNSNYRDLRTKEIYRKKGNKKFGDSTEIEILRVETTNYKKDISGLERPQTRYEYIRDADLVLWIHMHDIVKH